MREYYKLMKLIEDFDNGAIEENVFWITVKEIADEGLKWYHKIMQDNM